MKKYNVSEAAKELGVTRQTIYYWIKKGWVSPKRDYRNYPVFTEGDIRRIKKWHNTLQETAPQKAIKPTATRYPLTANRKPLPTPTWKWQDLQKMLWK